MAGLDVSDLLAVRYRRGSTDPALGLDCYTACQAAARRVPALEPMAAGLSEEAALAALTAGEGPWERLGGEACLARLVGDLVLTRSEGAPAGLLMLTDPGARLFLTSTPERGVHLVNARALRGGVVGVYRWTGNELPGGNPTGTRLPAEGGCR